MHHVAKAVDVRLTPDYLGRANSYARCSLVNHSVGSVHPGFSLWQIGAGGMQHSDIAPKLSRFIDLCCCSIANTQFHNSCSIGFQGPKAFCQESHHVSPE